MEPNYRVHRGKKLRKGFTTGSCAAAAAKAAATMLTRQTLISEITINTPAGIQLTLPVTRPQFDKTSACCGIIKDGGDDIDATNGMEIVATVQRRSDSQVKINGGEGIGTITKPGFWGTVGKPAINPVPRKMIEDSVRQVADLGWNITLSAPEGEAIAAKTMNKRIGIMGGISIIGTTGIVEPMSNEALKKTIYLEIDTIRSDGSDTILLFLGNYGQRVAEELELKDPSVKISNFIGDAVIYCHNIGFKTVTLIGHIGKLAKLSVGAFNTHSAVCDTRIEAFVYYLALAGADTRLMSQVAECTDTEEALNLIQSSGYGHLLDDMKKGCVDRLRKYVKNPEFNIKVIIYSMDQGIL